MKQTEQNFWLDLGLIVTFLSTIFLGFILWLVIPLKSAAFFLGLDHHPCLRRFFRTGVRSFCNQYPTHLCCCVCDVGTGRFDDIPGFPGI